MDFFPWFFFLHITFHFCLHNASHIYYVTLESRNATLTSTYKSLLNVMDTWRLSEWCKLLKSQYFQCSSQGRLSLNFVPFFVELRGEFSLIWFGRPHRDCVRVVVRWAGARNFSASTSRSCLNSCWEEVRSRTFALYDFWGYCS